MDQLKVHQHGLVREDEELIKYNLTQDNCRVNAYDYSENGYPGNLINPTEDAQTKYILEYAITDKCKSYIDFDFKRPILISAIGFKSAGCCPSMDPGRIKIFHNVWETQKTPE